MKVNHHDADATKVYDILEKKLINKVMNIGDQGLRALNCWAKISYRNIEETVFTLEENFTVKPASRICIHHVRNLLMFE